jgi:3-deoxy-D-manno-octulosonic acid hydroxylase-like protein
MGVGQGGNALERGEVVALAVPETLLAPEQRRALLEDARLARGHKNIAYDPSTDRLSGLAHGSREAAALVKSGLRAYAMGVAPIVAALVPAYAARWTIGPTSFRPLEESQRALPTLSRNDLLHVDAFPSRPTGGDRLLRVFTNLEPRRPRRWEVGEDFAALIERVWNDPRLRRPREPSAPSERARRALARLASHLGVAPALARRSAYDDFMRGLHDFMKTSAAFQAGARRRTVEFAPGASWIALTDQVPHAVRAGRAALEQTFVVPCAALDRPESAPIAILERKCGFPLGRVAASAAQAQARREARAIAAPDGA